MNITVNEQPKRFWLATVTKSGKYEWLAVIGHEIEVADYKFSIVIADLALRVNEKTTGYKVFDVELTPLDLIDTASKEGTMELYRDFVGERLKMLINKVPNLSEKISKIKKDQIEKLGEMPEIEDVDEELILAEVSGSMQ